MDITYIAQVPIEQNHKRSSVVRMAYGPGKGFNTGSSANIKYFLGYKVRGNS